MKIVIDVPDDFCARVINAGGMSVTDAEIVVNAFYLGEVLPKGHGRLIDVNDLLYDIDLEDNDYNRDVNLGEIITLEIIDRIPTIIEADKEVDDEQ